MYFKQDVQVSEKILAWPENSIYITYILDICNYNACLDFSFLFVVIYLFDLTI